MTFILPEMIEAGVEVEEEFADCKPEERVAVIYAAMQAVWEIAKVRTADTVH